ncbi:hypothetical protein CAPTEDRAFT_134113, partial [Capitella teleta]
ALWLVSVAAIWGFTNPLIKAGGKGIENVKSSGNAFSQFLMEFKFLFLNWKYLLPFLLNQSGSVLYYMTLASADLSLAVPVTNSLTFVFTGLGGKLCGEEFGSKRQSYSDVLGVLFQ